MFPDGIWPIIANLPPAWAAFTVISLAALGLAYAWRKAGDEARRERAKAQDARDASSDALISRIADRQSEVLDVLTDIKSDVRVLIDRGRK